MIPIDPEASPLAWEGWDAQLPQLTFQTEATSWLLPWNKYGDHLKYRL